METCSNCGGVIGKFETPFVWANQVVCAPCHGRLQMAFPQAMPATLTPGLPAKYVPPASVTAPILVSAIANIVFGLGWLSTCIGAFLLIPISILCVFEFALYTRANRFPPAELARKARTLAIFEIVVGLVNPVTLVCGIVLLIHTIKFEDSLEGRT